MVARARARTRLSRPFGRCDWLFGIVLSFGPSQCYAAMGEASNVAGSGRQNTGAPQLIAEIQNCSVSCVRSAGSIIYVIADASCENFGSLAATLEVRTDERLESPRVTQIHTTFEDFGSTVTLKIPRLGRKEVTVFREDQWYRISNEGSWTPRDGAGLLIKDGKAFLLGGWLHGPLTNEVWVSDNLRDWTFLGFAPWAPRHGAAWVVHADRLYVIGGELIADVWSSADGVTWRREAADAPFGKRYTPNAASLGNKLLVYAGQHWEPLDWCVESPECGVVGNRDVWESEDGGRTWQIAASAAPWAGRGLIHGSIVFDGKIHLIGGGLKEVNRVLPGPPFAVTMIEYSDIWTSHDGRTWERELARFSIPARTHFSVLGTPGGCFISDGSVGSQTQVSNDLFYATDCIHYTQIPDPPLQRRHASSLAYFNGTVVILGGPPLGGALTDVWQYIPKSDCEDPDLERDSR
jgi:hypothetical protein